MRIFIIQYYTLSSEIFDISLTIGSWVGGLEPMVETFSLNDAFKDSGHVWPFFPPFSSCVPHGSGTESQQSVAL